MTLSWRQGLDMELCDLPPFSGVDPALEGSRGLSGERQLPMLLPKLRVFRRNFLGQ